MNNDPCLWVRDAARKGHRDPGSLRCRRGGSVFCRPCLDSANAAPSLHFHTAYGFPLHGLRWTDDEHATTEAAWLAVGEIVKENWRQDRAQILAAGERHGNVKGAYARAAMLCLSAHLPANSSFEIPALDSDHDAMSYGIISCDVDHVSILKVG